MFLPIRSGYPFGTYSGTSAKFAKPEFSLVFYEDGPASPAARLRRRKRDPPRLGGEGKLELTEDCDRRIAAEGIPEKLCSASPCVPFWEAGSSGGMPALVVSPRLLSPSQDKKMY
jgi:hypothetical protein